MKVENHFNFDKSPIVTTNTSSSNREKKEKEDSKKFILIEKKNSEVYSDEDWKELIEKNDSLFNSDKLVKSLSYGIPKKL